jgi:hypothetical protein
LGSALADVGAGSWFRCEESKVHGYVESNFEGKARAAFAARNGDKERKRKAAGTAKDHYAATRANTKDNPTGATKNPPTTRTTTTEVVATTRERKTAANTRTTKAAAPTRERKTARTTIPITSP